jgi:hypothetical protein
MNDALQKTVTLILLIVLGLALKKKFSAKDRINGIKEIVLSVALPSTIFIALMKIELDSSLLFVPLAALAFNFFMYFITPLAMPLFGIDKESATAKTLQMLMPSLAPGLSCFPLIIEFLGEDSLAIAAMADVGNKFFVLIFLYLFALNLYLANTQAEQTNVLDKVKSLLLNMLQEPINIIMFIALGLISLDIHFVDLPTIVQDVFNKTALLMTPLVLIFIGLAVQLKEGQKRVVLTALIFRAGITLIFSGLLIFIFEIHEPGLVMLAIVVPQSSASFWPFAHIATFEALEEQKEILKERRTFRMELAILVLAISLPFSTLLILGILSAGTFFAHLPILFGTGIAFMTFSALPIILKKWFYKKTPDISRVLLKNR